MLYKRADFVKESRNNFTFSKLRKKENDKTNPELFRQFNKSNEDDVITGLSCNNFRNSYTFS